MASGGFLVNHRTKSRYRLDGCRRSRIKPLADLARPFLSLIKHPQLPNVVDLRSFLNSIEEQYMAGSCVGSALASILEYFYYYTTGHVKTFSRLFIYYNARMLEDETSQRNATETDSGADIQYAIVGLIKFGCCEEQFWPFYEYLINAQPSHAAYENGQNYRLTEFRRLPNNINNLRQCLAEGYPFVMAIKIFSSFASDHRGYIPMPKSYEKSSQYRHAVVCVGYIHPKRVFIIRNSHGIHWGDHGYGYLPYEYVTDKILTKDLWALKTIKGMAPSFDLQQISWNDYPTLSKSNSRLDFTDDQSHWDIEYSNDDDTGENDKVDAPDSYGQHVRRYSQNSESEYPSSPIPIEKNSWTKPISTNHFLFMPMSAPPVSFLNTNYPYYSTMFGSTPYFRPFQ